MSVELCIGDCSESRDWLFFIVQLVVAIGTLTAVGVAALAARGALLGLKREEEGRRASLMPLLKLDGDVSMPLGPAGPIDMTVRNFGTGPAQDVRGRLWAQYDPGFSLLDDAELDRQKAEWPQRAPHYLLSAPGLGAGESARFNWIPEKGCPSHEPGADMLLIYVLGCADIFRKNVPGAPHTWSFVRADRA